MCLLCWLIKRWPPAVGPTFDPTCCMFQWSIVHEKVWFLLFLWCLGVLQAYRDRQMGLVNSSLSTLGWGWPCTLMLCLFVVCVGISLKHVKGNGLVPLLSWPGLNICATKSIHVSKIRSFAIEYGHAWRRHFLACLPEAHCMQSDTPAGIFLFACC